jgi:hypothetical protein
VIERGVDDGGKRRDLICNACKAEKPALQIAYLATRRGKADFGRAGGKDCATGCGENFAVAAVFNSFEIVRKKISYIEKLTYRVKWRKILIDLWMDWRFLECIWMET